MTHKIYSYITAWALAACATSLQAQTTAYICDGYDYETVQIKSRTDIQVSADQSQVTLGDKTFDIADVDSIVFNEPQYPAVDIVWADGTAEVNIDKRITGVQAQVVGGYVTIRSTNTTDEILYRLSGSSTDGGLVLNGNYKLRMDLNGVSLTSKNGCPMDIECGKRIEVKMLKDTENTFVDGAGNTQKGAFYAKGHLEFKGKGTLNVTGNAKHAICAGEYLQFKPSCGTVNILSAVSDGIHCGKGKQNDDNSRFIMDGGTVNVSGAGSDCIDCDDYGSAFINGGTLTLNVTQSDGTGLKADSIVYMTGGHIRLNVSGDISQGIRYCMDGHFTGGTIDGTISGNGAKGIKAKKAKSGSTVMNGADAHFDGTDMSLTISGGTYTVDNTKCYGLHIDKDLYQTAGTITFDITNAEADSYKAKATYLTGGTITPNK